MNSKKYKYYFNALEKITYQKQDHWDVFGKKYYDKISDFDTMMFFRRNGLSNMLETGLPSQERDKMINSGEKYDIDYALCEIGHLKERFSELKSMIGPEIDDIKMFSTVGDPRRFIHRQDEKEYILNFDDLYHVYAAWQIRRFINLYYKDKPPCTMLEIGAGYGNLADKIKSTFKDLKYIIVDLPEALLLQHYYLSSNDPSCKIINLLGEEDVSNLDLNNLDYDYMLIPFNLYDKLKIKFDVVINSRSFGEMPRKTLENYIGWIQDNIEQDGLLYTVNRYVFTKSRDKNKIRNYPFDENWKMIMSQPQWLQTHLHEFILQRTDELDIPLSFLLKSFPVSTPPPGPIMEDILPQAEWLKHQRIKKDE